MGWGRSLLCSVGNMDLEPAPPAERARLQLHFSAYVLHRIISDSNLISETMAVQDSVLSKCSWHWIRNRPTDFMIPGKRMYLQVIAMIARRGLDESCSAGDPLKFMHPTFLEPMEYSK